ncbi:MAG: barstar family protein [Planctomycetota bacterium]
MTPTPFTFFDAAPPTGDLLVVVSAGIDDKSKLFEWYARALAFPAHFGRNWDALRDCLSDLGWLAARHIVIAHDDLPLARHPREASAYLRVLHDALQRWRLASGAAHTIDVAFPSAARALVLRHGAAR